MKGSEEFLFSKNEAEFEENQYNYSKKKLDDYPQHLASIKEVAEDSSKTTYEDSERAQVQSDVPLDKKTGVQNLNTNPPGLRMF